ncbi:MAG: DNA repair protein RecO [Rhodobacterales bacterium]|nr:DNA repair protein RecO [Rhodobacterales bacterium]
MIGEPMIVVGGMPLGEADRIVRFLSATQGRLTGVARGARRSTKRFGGLLDVGTQSAVVLRKGKGSMWSISSMELLSAPARSRADIDRIALLAYGCELCSALAPEGHPAAKLTQLLAVWLELLELEGAVGETSRVALEAKALTFAGFTPAFVSCCRCSLPLEDPIRFDAESGGGMHEHCGSGTRVFLDTLSYFEMLRRSPMLATVHTALPDHTVQDRWLLANFAIWHLGRDLKSRTLLQDLESHRTGR